MDQHTEGVTDVVNDAQAWGFRLMQRDLDTGQLAWTWMPDNDGPQPRFLTERQAIAYMRDKLQRLCE